MDTLTSTTDYIILCVCACSRIGHLCVWLLGISAESLALENVGCAFVARQLCRNGHAEFSKSWTSGYSQCVMWNSIMLNCRRVQVQGFYPILYSGSRVDHRPTTIVEVHPYINWLVVGDMFIFPYVYIYIFIYIYIMYMIICIYRDFHHPNWLSYFW